jgi:predicted RNA-binding Zn ribbon-like protein
MKEYLQVIEPHDFDASDFVGGDPAIDFINTVTARDGAPRDWLASYAGLVDWADKAGLLPVRTLRALARRAEREPAAAARALGRAKALREELFTLLSAMAAGRAPPAEALRELRKYWIQGAGAHELRFQHGRVAPVIGDVDDLDAIASVVAWRVVEHVLPSPVDRLRVCAGPECSWLFIDRSKAGRRRWCDMAVCGNAAKSRRFYARRRKRA